MTVWCTLTLTLAITDENGLHWAAQVNATFYIPAQQPPPPTFSTGFVSLRHTLAMDLKLVNQRGRAVTQSLTFRNPLQIAYASNERQTHVDRMPDLPTIDYFDTIKESCVSELLDLLDHNGALMCCLASVIYEVTLNSNCLDRLPIVTQNLNSVYAKVFRICIV